LVIHRTTALLSAGVSVVAVAGSLLAAHPAGADDTVGGIYKPVGGDQAGAVLGQINSMRAANGCGPVAFNPQLTSAAARQADDMLVNGVQSHTGSDGSSLVQRVTDAGYTYAKVSEILFWSTGPGASAAAAVGWWMNSPRHRAVIVDCSLTEAGFSVVSSGNKVTVAGDFGTK
jgi:uncharacterized protein YkwD